MPASAPSPHDLPPSDQPVAEEPSFLEMFRRLQRAYVPPRREPVTPDAEAVSTRRPMATYRTQ
jgi:hypothetical protein